MDAEIERRDERAFTDFLGSVVLLFASNLVLAALKIMLGYWSDSSAYRAVGWNNTADFTYTILLAGGLWLTTRPADASHPEGHARFESLVGLLVSFVIAGTGLYVWWDAYRSWVDPGEVQMGLFAVSVLVASMGIKGLVSWFLIRRGKALSSPALDAIGNDQGGDVLADLSALLALVTARVGWQWIDPIVAGLIGLLILRIGWDTLEESIFHLTGRAAPEKLVEEIRRVVREDSRFSDPNEIRAHHVGPTLFVSLNVKAAPDLPLQEVHEGEEGLKRSLLSLDDVSRVYVHVEPRNQATPGSGEEGIESP